MKPKKKTWTYVALIIGTAILSPSISKATLIYNPATDHYYSLVNSGSNGSWHNAENNAIALGGHLVTINDAAEESWLRTTFGYTENFWIGFTDTAQEGQWEWISGEPVTYTHWNGGEPNNYAPPSHGEDFAVLNWNDSTGAWNDLDHERTGYTWGIAEVVPEPHSAALFAIVLALIQIRRRIFS